MSNEDAVSQLERLKSKLIADYGLTADELSDLPLEDVLEIYLAATDSDAGKPESVSADTGPKIARTTERESATPTPSGQAFPVEHGHTPLEPRNRISAPGFTVPPLPDDAPAARLGSNAGTPTDAAAAKKRTKMKWRIGVVVGALAIGGTLNLLSALEDDTPSLTADSTGATTTAERTYPTFSRAPYTPPSPRPPPVPTYNAAAMTALLGKPCSPPGATYPPPVGDTGYSNDEVLLGIYCLPTGWASIDESQGSCASYSTVVNVTATGVPLTCIGERLFAEGETVPVLYAATYTVGRGTGQVAPGTYEAFNVTNCYWERLDDAGNIIDNNFINGAPRAEFTIRESDFAINIEGCGGWTPVP